MSDRIREETKAKALRAAALLSASLPGEAGAAVQAVDRLLPAGLTVAEIVADAIAALPVSSPAADVVRPVDLSGFPVGGWLRCPWVKMARDCLNHRAQFDANELAFLSSMATWRKPPSDKQEEWLKRLHSTLREAA